ncbi:Wall-associated receptor kinase, C-terminal [Trema orientale]|uniref:non-specific serine/threonine protein kinase n=1 Tax=Trema orientale TaxID=63057 RepID=A0A2P5EN38_TREOI|nr:Wall-associated receptor kinase, C-terminal [Trema orientale]
MNPLLHSSSFLFLTIVIASVGISSSFRVLKDEAKFEACSRLFECGNRTLGYPFWGGDRIQDCGLPELKLECQNNTYPQVGIDSRNFYILDIREMDQILTVVGADMVGDGCPERIVNTTIDDSPFECASNNAKLTYVYNCSNGIPSSVPSKLRCARKIEPVYDGYYTLRPWVRENHSCSSGISIPLLGKYYTDLTSGFLTATNALKKGFDLKYKRDYGQRACWGCLESSGQCGFDRTSQEFVCFSHQGMTL